MDKKEFFEKFLRPRGWVLGIVYTLTVLVCALAVVFAIISPSGVWGVLTYAVYGVAALLLSYAVYTIVVYAPTIKQRSIAAMKKNAFLCKLLDDYGYKTVALGTVSLVLNIAFAAFHAVLAVWQKDGWYVTLALYYTILTAIRGGLVLYHRKKNAKPLTELERKKIEAKKCRSCGILLVALPWTLSFEVLQMIVVGQGYAYVGIMIYVVAAYTFYKISLSIFNFVKARKNDDLTVSALRAVGLADALVSVLALQTAMFYSFGQNGGIDTGVMNAITGAVVCALTVAIGVMMIVRANKTMKELREREESGESRNEI